MILQKQIIFQIFQIRDDLQNDYLRFIIIHNLLLIVIQMNSKKINVAIIAHFHKLMIILRDQFFLTRISIFDYYRSMSLHNDTKLVKIKIRIIYRRM